VLLQQGVGGAGRPRLPAPALLQSVVQVGFQEA
jgi:hypothetical protein